jgi:amidase
MTIAEYASYDALGLAELVRRGEVTAAELVESAIERIERHNGALNAVIFEAYDLARSLAVRQPRAGTGGSLQGVPMLLKDAGGDCQGMPTTFACRALAELPPSDHDSSQVAHFKAAGLIPLGKTNTPEWGFLGCTEPFLYGATHNPWKEGISPGGSSGGSAAAVASGMVPVAHGNDGGGSIRIPASACGLVGLKPSRARVSWGPVLGEVIDGFTCEHVLTRSVRDCAAVLDATAGPDPGEPYGIEAPERSFLEEVSRRPERLRIAFWTGTPAGAELHPDCKEAVTITAHLCEELGHEVEEAVPEANLRGMLASFLITYFAAAQLDVDVVTPMLIGRPPREEELEPLSWAMAERGRSISALDYQLAAINRQLEARAIGRFHERYDVWLTPTLASPPIAIGLHTGAATDAEAFWDEALEYFPYTPIQNATGQPALSLPLHWNGEGIPIGTQLTSAVGNEAVLFRLGAQLEEARPWSGRRPFVWG